MGTFLSKSTLESWLEEFRTLGYVIRSTLRVIDQDGADGADTGLVAVGFANASTGTYIQPDTADPSRWVVTMEPRESPMSLGAPGLLALSSELATAAALCAFLEAKSRDAGATASS